MQFGNLPYGFRANTWLIPPIAAQSPSVFPPLPAEDEAWGGNGGGLGRDGKSDLIPWANEFLFVASMPCKTAEERQIRDRKAFLLHNLFVDVAIFRAIKAVHHVMGKPELIYPSNCKILYTEIIGDLRIDHKRVIKFFGTFVQNIKFVFYLPTILYFFHWLGYNDLEIFTYKILYFQMIFHKIIFVPSYLMKFYLLLYLCIYM